jgi:hypothetical protein
MKEPIRTDHFIAFSRISMPSNNKTSNLTTMKNIRIVLPIFSLIILVLSCDWILKPGPCDASGPIIVYKTKQDYSNLVTVQISKNGKTVTAYPGPGDSAGLRPIQLTNGYFLKRMVGDAVLSLRNNQLPKCDNLK